MAARMGNGVPGVRYTSRGALHLGTAQGHGMATTACGLVCYGYPKEVAPEAITCKDCKTRM